MEDLPLRTFLFRRNHNGNILLGVVIAPDEQTALDMWMYADKENPRFLMGFYEIDQSMPRVYVYRMNENTSLVG